jgi:hypothetical protein
VTLRRPTDRRVVWVHIDEFDKPNGQTWAVQFHDGRRWRYYTTGGVCADGVRCDYFEIHDRYPGQQPRAVGEYSNVALTLSRRTVKIARKD